MRYFQTNPHWYPFHADKCHHFPEVVTTVDAAGQVVELFAERVVETQIHLEDCLQSIEAQKCILCIETAKSWLQDMISVSLELILLAHWLSQKLSVWFSYQFLAGSSRFTSTASGKTGIIFAGGGACFDRFVENWIRTDERVSNAMKKNLEFLSFVCVYLYLCGAVATCFLPPLS